MPGSGRAVGVRPRAQHQVAHLLRDQVLGLGKIEHRREVGGRTGTDHDRVIVELGRQVVADQGLRVGRVVELPDRARVLRLAFGSLAGERRGEQRRIGSRFGGKRQADRLRDRERTRLARIKAHKHVGELRRLQAGTAHADTDHARFTLALKPVEHGESQGVVDRIPHVGIENHPDRRPAPSELHDRAIPPLCQYRPRNAIRCWSIQIDREPKLWHFLPVPRNRSQR